MRLPHTCASDAAARASGSNSAKSSAMGAPSSRCTASSTSAKGLGSTLSWSTSNVLQRTRHTRCFMSYPCSFPQQPARIILGCYRCAHGSPYLLIKQDTTMGYLQKMEHLRYSAGAAWAVVIS